jgi:hypothetical protein
MRTRTWAVAGLAVMALAGSTGCGHPGGSGTGTLPTSGQGLGTVPVASTTPAAVKTTPAPLNTAPALTCTQIRNSTLGSNAMKYNGYVDGIPLADGTWSGEDGNTVTVTVCATGDLDGDGAVDALASVMLSSAGTGRFYTLAVWLNADGKPVFAALKDIDDRTPVQSISIAAGKATVVYLTRHADEPMAQLSIKRTAIFKLSGSTLTEVSHSDVPYTP